jgi:hypothetical protein
MLHKYCSKVLAVHVCRGIQGAAVPARPKGMLCKQGTTQVLRLSTGSPYKALQLSTGFFDTVLQLSTGFPHKVLQLSTGFPHKVLSSSEIPCMQAYLFAASWHDLTSALWHDTFAERRVRTRVASEACAASRAACKQPPPVTPVTLGILHAQLPASQGYLVHASSTLQGHPSRTALYICLTCSKHASTPHRAPGLPANPNTKP